MYYAKNQLCLISLGVIYPSEFNPQKCFYIIRSDKKIVFSLTHKIKLLKLSKKEKLVVV